MCDEAESARAIDCECSATCSSVSGPYKCWLPVTNHTSNCLRSIMICSLLIKLQSQVGCEGGHSPPSPPPRGGGWEGPPPPPNLPKRKAITARTHAYIGSAAS